MKHINIPIFIPHLGCPNQCIFCNQRHISGSESFSEETVKNEILKVLSTINEKKIKRRVKNSKNQQRAGKDRKRIQM